MRTRVLVVDDEESVRRVARMILEADGYDVVEAHDVDSALAAVRNDDPRVVVLDYALPGNVNGLELAAMISGLAPRARILMFSAYLENDGRFAGVDGVLNKANVDDLGQRVAGLAPSAS